MAKGDLKKSNLILKNYCTRNAKINTKTFIKVTPPPPIDAVVLKGFDLKKKYIFKNVKNLIPKNYNTTIGDIIKQASSDSVDC